MKVSEYVALCSTDPHKADDMVAPLCGYKLVDDPNRGQVWESPTGWHSTTSRSFIAGGWAAFGAMWDALPGDDATWSYIELRRSGDLKHIVEERHHPFRFVTAPTRNIAAAAALLLAAGELEE